MSKNQNTKYEKFNEAILQSSPNEKVQSMFALPSSRIWLQQPEESDEAYEAFETYCDVKSRDMGGTIATAERLFKAKSLISKWSSRHNWKERYLAYQNYNRIVEEGFRREEQKKSAQKWAVRREEIQETGFEVGAALIKRAKLLLDLPVANKRIERTIEVDGRKIPTVTILDFQQHPRDARLMLETGLKLQRLSADMSTINVSHMPEDIDTENMSEEELLAYANELKAMRDAQIANKTKL